MTTKFSLVIFLDVEGVLDSADWMARRDEVQRFIDESPEGIMGGIDPAAVARLNRVTDETGAALVVSSTIRDDWDSFAECRGVLKSYGVTGKIIGRTPRFSGAKVRGLEIQAWLDENPWVERFAIIDDDADMHHLAHRLVKTTFLHGMLDEHAAALVEMLTGPTKP